MPCTCGGDLGFLTFHDPGFRSEPASGCLPAGGALSGLSLFDDDPDDELAGLVPYGDDPDDELAGLVPYGDDPDDELAGLVPYGDDPDGELAGLVPHGYEDDEGDVGDLVSSAGAGLAAGAATGNPYVGVAVGLADAIGIDVNSLVGDFTSWLGFDACSSKNKRKWRRRLLAKSPEARREMARKKRVPGAVGNCHKYAIRYLARLVVKDEEKWKAENRKRQASAAEQARLRQEAEDRRRRQEEDRRRRQEEERRRQAEFRRLQEEKAAVEAERKRREEEAKRREEEEQRQKEASRRRMLIGGGVAVAGVGTGIALYLRKRSRERAA